jgi:UDP-glucose 4-epimerase
MKIVITGALGHIGAQLIRELPLSIPNCELILIDNLLTQRYCSLFNLNQNFKYRFYPLDIFDAELEKIFQDAQAVIHLAAITNATESFNNPSQVEKINYDGTIRIAEACSRVSVPLIYLSTTSVYGTQQEVVDENCPDSDLRPQSPYAESKLNAERYLTKLSTEKNDFQFVTCRFGTIFGISPGIRFHTAINKFCWQTVLREPLSVWKTALHQERPYLYLDDAIRALIFIIKHKVFTNEIYNVLSFNTTVSDIVEQLKKHFPELKVDFVDSAIMNQLSYKVSSKKFTSLGFSFKGQLSKGITETLQLLRGCNNLP